MKDRPVELAWQETRVAGNWWSMQGRHSISICGVGIDTVDLGHFRRTISAHPAFPKMVFTRREYRRYRHRLQSLAARFGVKEAFLKAASGLDEMDWRDVETLGDSSGRPYVVLHGRAFKWCRRAGVTKVLVSMSHSRTTAVAQVVLVRRQSCQPCLRERVRARGVGSAAAWR